MTPSTPIPAFEWKPDDCPVGDGEDAWEAIVTRPENGEDLRAYIESPGAGETAWFWSVNYGTQELAEHNMACDADASGWAATRELAEAACRAALEAAWDVPADGIDADAVEAAATAAAKGQGDNR